MHGILNKMVERKLFVQQIQNIKTKGRRKSYFEMQHYWILKVLTFSCGITEEVFLSATFANLKHNIFDMQIW